MDNIISSEKTCGNCRYYLQHFAKRNAKLIKTGCGICLHRKIKARTKSPFTLCAYWEENPTEKEERNRSIQYVLRTMCEQLSQIVLILQDDAKN
ncbi:MAG: hypothetical protein FWH03_02295 [Firmicutes bacterium]|nr:hypothetical protein [Bacillota bacterium]